MEEIGKSVNRRELKRNPGIEINFKSVASDEHPNQNEDSIFILPEKKAVGVFDGVGGYAGGNIASEIASQICSKLILSIEKELTLKEATARIREILFEANQAVYLAAKKENNYMGTTASMVYIWKDPEGKSKAIIGNVGDSRVYLFRDSNLTQITLDDNVISLFIKNKKTAYEIQSKLNNALDPKNLTDSEKEFFNLRNKITQALGQESIIPRIYIIDLEPKDRLIVCSDGISDNLTDNEISQILKFNSNNNKAVEKLIEAAQGRSRSQHFRAKPDDMTVAIIEEISPTPTLKNQISKEKNYLKIGDIIKVRRSSGQIEGGWIIVNINEETGYAEVIRKVGNDYLIKSVPMRELEELNE